MYTAINWSAGINRAMIEEDDKAFLTLVEHSLFSDHCGGYDIYAWPCPTAAAVIDSLYDKTGE